MPDALEELPLFPLETVLFPYAALQLHIFEDRYREMVRFCLDESREFGIVLIRSGPAVGGTAEPYMVGTSVSIREVHHHADGRMDIQVRGERRFRIRKLDFSQPYLVGFVETLDEADPVADEEFDRLVSEAQQGFQSLVAGILARPESTVQVVFPPDPIALSFTIANLLPMDNRDKQRLLETTDTAERLEALLPVLEQQLEEIETMEENFDAQEVQRIHRLSAEDLRDWSGPN